jgi:hypothetical protein
MIHFPAIMDSFAPEILLLIFSFLDQNGLYKCTQVCKKWRALLMSGNHSLLQRMTVFRTLIQKDLRLDTLRNWRVVVTPMIQGTGSSRIWKYGYAFCHRTRGIASSVFPPPYCNSTTQKRIYRRSIEAGLTPPVLPKDAESFDMPLLKKRHRMHLPTQVISVRLIAKLQMCLKNFQIIYMSKPSRQNIPRDFYSLSEFFDDEKGILTNVVVHMQSNHSEPMQNTKHAFNVMRTLLDGFPVDLVCDKWIESEIVVCRLPSQRTSAVVPVGKSAEIVRYKPIAKEPATHFMEECVQHIQDSAGKIMDQWIENVDKFPWSAFRTTDAVLVSLSLRDPTEKLTDTEQVAKILMNRQKPHLEAYWRSMRFQGFRPEKININLPIFMHIMVVFYFYFHNPEKGKYAPFARQSRTGQMQKLSYAIHSQRFLIKEKMPRLQDKEFLNNFKAYLEFMKKQIPDAIGSVYKAYVSKMICSI